MADDPKAALPPTEGDFKKMGERVDALERENAEQKKRLRELEAEKAARAEAASDDDDDGDDDEWLRKATS